MKALRSLAQAVAFGAIALQFSIPARATGADIDSGPSAEASSSGRPTGKRSCRPEYPPAARTAKAEGKTTVNLTIAASGETRVEILESAGPTPEHKLLDQAAADALLSCPFKPGIDKQGNPISTSTKVVYTWRLDPVAKNPGPDPR